MLNSANDTLKVRMGNLTLETSADTNVECKRCTFDVTLTSLTGASPISAFKPRQIDIIRTALTLYIRVTKGP